MKGAIIFVAGGAIGFIAGWFACKNNLNKKVDEEVQQMREYFKQKEDALGKAVETVKDNVDKSMELVRRYEKPPLESFTAKYKSSNEEIPGPTEEDYEEEEMGKNYIPPKIISLDSYGEEDEYDEQELLYYQDNDVLVDEVEDVIEDPDHLIGTALTKYDFKTNDETDIYVVNENLSTYYHIHKMFDSWEG